MPGFGRFKMTDALPPEQKANLESSQSNDYSQAGATGPARKGKGKGKGKSSGKAGKATAKGPDAEQVREARESAQAKNSEASTRDRMVDIGRGNQQAGRQRAK
jgi:hypothetical protein